MKLDIQLRVGPFFTGNKIQPEKLWPGLQSLSNFINLRTLDLGSCGPFTLTDSAFAEMGPLPNLEDLVSILASQ